MDPMKMTEALDEAVSREILFQSLEIFLSGTTRCLGIQSAGGESFYTERGGSNQTFLLEVNNKKAVIPNSITRGHNTSMGYLDISSRPYPVDRLGALEEGWPNCSSGEVAHHLRHP